MSRIVTKEQYDIVPGHHINSVGNAIYIAFPFLVHDFDALYRDFTMKIDFTNIKRASLGDGGIRITTPNKTCYYSIWINGEVDNLRQSIVRAARQSGYKLANVCGNVLHTEEYGDFDLDECIVEVH